jgi:hypothetical protein
VPTYGKKKASLSYIQGFQLFGIIRGWGRGGEGPLGLDTKCTYRERTPKTIQETYKKHKKNVSREANIDGCIDWYCSSDDLTFRFSIAVSTLQRQNTEISKQIFSEKEYSCVCE